MTKIRKSLAFRSGVMALVALGLIAVAVSASAVTLKQIKERGYIRIAVSYDIPYGYVDASGHAKGAGPDVAKAVLKRMGIDQIQWVVMPFGSLIPAVKANRVDMAAEEMNTLPQRCRAVDFSIPNTTYGEGLLVLKGNPKKIHSYEQFAKSPDLKVAIMSGADELPMMQKLGVPMNRIVMIKSNSDAIAAVATGRADAVAATGLSVYNLAQKSDKLEMAEPFKDPVIDGKEVRSWGAFAFNQASDSFREAFDKQLKKFKHTDAWENILKGYGFNKKDREESFKKTVQQLCGKGYNAPQS